MFPKYDFVGLDVRYERPLGDEAFVAKLFFELKIHIQNFRFEILISLSSIGLFYAEKNII